MFVADLWTAQGRSSLHRCGWRNAVGRKGNQSTRGPHARLDHISIGRLVIERSGGFYRLALQVENAGAGDFVAIAIW